ncbi:arylacetamide deacetylase-like 4 [Eublepharis macularius]|uniref:Arylacetamide deacetylase-like 4 n=1 Tax=Eublepharis macularius TaxID=481883 RepID=A0AA97KN31_EUBMA|nr:arylacetamide deacetylase-like 4 [Eublepharis macularius]
MNLSLVLMIYLALSFVFWRYLSFRRVGIPVGIFESCKYALAAVYIDAFFLLGSVLETLGICSQIKFVRLSVMLCALQTDRNLHIRDERFGNVPVRIYEPKHSYTEPRRCVIYIHGGVAMIGTIRAYAAVCRRLALRSETMVVNIGFRLGPEHSHPAQLEDCLSAVVYLLKEARNYGVDPNRIILAGDSSGGTLVSLVSQNLLPRKDIPKIQAQLLIYPFFQTLDVMLPSYQQNRFAPILCRERAIKLAVRFMTGEMVDIKGVMKNAHVPDDIAVKYRKWISADNIPDEFKKRGYVPIVPAPFSKKLYKIAELSLQPTFCPLLAEDDIVRQLPETFLLTCEYDVLRDDGLLYKKRLEDNGVPVTWLHLKKGFHGIMFNNDLMFFQYKEAEHAMKHIVDFIQRF